MFMVVNFKMAEPDESRDSFGQPQALEVPSQNQLKGRNSKWLKKNGIQTFLFFDF